MVFQSVLKAASGGSWNILPQCSSGVGHYFFCSYRVHSRHLPSMALKTFCSLHCLLALILWHLFVTYEAQEVLKTLKQPASLLWAEENYLCLSGGRWLAWLAPDFCADIRTEGHGEFPNAHLPCTDCGENWRFLGLPLILWFWGENVSGNNCLLRLASSVCALEQLSWWMGKTETSFLLGCLALWHN